MANMWWDYFKLWSFVFTSDPLSQKDNDKQITGAGVSQPDAIPDIRQDGSFWGGSRGMIRLRDSNDFVDLSSVTNRQSRYKEYERLRNVAEIETAMTVFSDESCLAGSTIVSTLFYGPQTIQWLEQNKANEEFLVYCWDFAKKDYTLGWAYNPRVVKTDETVKVMLDDGSFFICTPDHRVMSMDGSWTHAGQLAFGNELKPFYRVPAVQSLTKLKNNQFPRIYTNEGWKQERQFIEEWKSGVEVQRCENVNKAIRMIAGGLNTVQVAKLLEKDWRNIEEWIHKAGFSYKEIKQLAKKKEYRRVIGVIPYETMPVYDLSVREYENFCGNSVIFHNCQTNDDGHTIKIQVKDKEVKDELEFLLFHLKMLNVDKKIWNWVKNLFIMGDLFIELVTNLDNPKDGILKSLMLPPESMYRIETTKGRLIEFQQSKEGPDQDSLTKAPITQATEEELRQSTAIRFHPEQVIHVRIGDDRKTFYPYGVSLMEAARGPAHQLRLMEDAMVVYRLCLTGDSRVRTHNGWKYIKDIKIGDETYTKSYDGNIIKSNIIWQVNNGVKKVYNVRSKHIEFTGTATHPVLVNRNGTIQYVDIQDLIPKKDQLLNITRDEEIPVSIPRIFGEKWAKLSSSQRKKFINIEFDNKSELIRKCGNFDRTKQFLYAEGKALPYEQAVKICNTFNLDENELVITNKGQVNSERINLPEYVNEEFARLFGFLIGDGSIRVKTQNQLVFSSGVDKKLNEYYAGLLQKYFGKVRFEEEKRERKTKGLGNYVIDSQIACRVLIEMGYISGARNKRIPNWVFTAPKNIRRSFVEGISDADGCERYTKAGTWFSTIEICNKELTEDIKEVWSSIGLCSGKLGHRKRNGGHEIEPGRKMPPNESYSIVISNCKLPEYENIWFVKYVGEEEVYDVTVDKDEHNIIVNGTCLHQTRAPERRVFYVDVGTLPPFKAEAFIDRMKDQFRKKKVASGKGGATGASQVEERWHAPAQDEDYWIPIRQNSQTRIETLPGASNLGEIDDAVYFRNKLFTAMNFPKNYFSNEDPNATRITLSAQDVKFARQIERLQSAVEDGIWEICDRHLRLRGFPEETYDDLKVKMTPPSDWRELSKAEVLTNRMTNANNAKGAQLFSDYDIYMDYLKMTEDEAKERLGRLKIQKLEDLKLQVLAQNPVLLGVASPGQGDQEIGSSSGGPNPMLSPDAGGGPPGMPPAGGAPPGPPAFASDDGPPATPGASATVLTDPTADDIKRYDLDIEDYVKDMDLEQPDFSEI